MARDWRSEVVNWAVSELKAKKGRKPRFAVRTPAEHVEHLELTRSAFKQRVAERKQRIPFGTSEFDDLVFREAADLVVLRKQATGLKWQIDHMLPLRAKGVSGLHVGNNIAVIPASLNIAKSNRMLYTETGDWLRL